MCVIFSSVTVRVGLVLREKTRAECLVDASTECQVSQLGSDLGAEEASYTREPG